MPTDAQLEQLAERISKAQAEGRALEPITSLRADFDLAAAWRVLELRHRARTAGGFKSVGRKIGFTNPLMWDRYGVRDPIWGHVYDDTSVQLDDAPATYSLGKFLEPRIEPEIVFHFAKAPPLDGDPRGILDAIDWVAHGFELVQSPFPGWKFQAPDSVAAGSLHAALLVGPQVPLAELGTDPRLALSDLSLQLFCDGELRESGKGSNVLGNPVLAVAHLIALLAKLKQPALRAGELVTTGTITNAPAIRAGERWTTKLEGIALPGLSLELLP